MPDRSSTKCRKTTWLHADQHAVCIVIGIMTYIGPTSTKRRESGFCDEESVVWAEAQFCLLGRNALARVHTTESEFHMLAAAAR